MKNIIEILTENSVAVSDEQKAAITKALSENYKTVAEFDKVKTKLEAERDDLKGSLTTAQDTLKGFEGVDVNELNGKIKELQESLTAKDTEYQQKIADRDFNDKLNGLISTAGGRDSEAIIPFLNIDTIKLSKNQDADLQAAIEKCKAEKDYLFGNSEPINNPVAPTGTNNANSNPLAAVRAAMGLKAD